MSPESLLVSPLAPIILLCCFYISFSSPLFVKWLISEELFCSLFFFLLGHRERLHAFLRLELFPCVCLCVNEWDFFTLLIRESQKCHSRKLLWTRLSDSYFCTILVSVCEWSMGLFCIAKYFDFIIHVDVSDSVIVLGSLLDTRLLKRFVSFFCFVFFPRWFCIFI